MTVHFFRGLLCICVILGFSVMTNAASVNIASSGEGELVKTVIGVWARNEKVSFSDSGTYTMTLTDFGFGSGVLDQVGVMVSTSVNTIADIVITYGSVSRQSITFNVSQGEYWLSMFAIAGSGNVGSFGLNFTEGSIAPVPIPPAIVFMITSLLGLVSFARQRKGSK